MTGSSDKSGADEPAPLKIVGSSAASASARRFYTSVTVAPVPASRPDAVAAFRILLDGRPVRTPARRIVELRTQALADAVAIEWEHQGERVLPGTMPMTRLVNSALDGVAGREREVVEDILKYAGNDALCYRADQPPGLVARQSGQWDPLLGWAGRELGGCFSTSTGIAHAAQDQALLTRFAGQVGQLGPLRLAALHVMTTLAGSALIAWAQCRGRLTAEAAWAAAHVDEDWQISQWGQDAEAEAHRAARWRDFEAAARLFELAG